MIEGCYRWGGGGSRGEMGGWTWEKGPCLSLGVARC